MLNNNPMPITDQAGILCDDKFSYTVIPWHVTEDSFLM